MDAEATKQLDEIAFSKKNSCASRPVKRPALQEFQPPYFDMYPDPGSLASETSDQMIRLKLSRLLRVRKCSSICPQKATENPTQMVRKRSLVLQAWTPKISEGNSRKCQFYSLHHQAPVVQRLDNAIHRINRYPVDKC